MRSGCSPERSSSWKLIGARWNSARFPTERRKQAHPYTRQQQNQYQSHSHGSVDSYVLLIDYERQNDIQKSKLMRSGEVKCKCHYTEHPPHNALERQVLHAFARLPQSCRRRAAARQQRSFCMCVRCCTVQTHERCIRPTLNKLRTNGWNICMTCNEIESLIACYGICVIHHR